MPDDFGWTEHVNKTGKPCAYCLKPSVQTFVVWQRGVRDHRVGLCEDHRREPETPLKPGTPDTGQRTALDVGDV